MLSVGKGVATGFCFRTFLTFTLWLVLVVRSLADFVALNLGFLHIREEEVCKEARKIFCF